MEILGSESSPRIISCDRQGTLGRNEVVWDMYNVLHYHIFVLGGSGVGKTHLVRNFADQSQIISTGDSTETVTYQKQVRLLDKCIDSEELTTVLLQIVEGSSINNSILDNISTDGIGFICMYSVDSRQSFDELTNHLKSILRMNPMGEPPPTLILGNKLDLSRQISTEECQTIAQTYACPFLEISSVGHPPEEAFSTIIREISFKKGQQSLPQSKSGFLEKRSGDLVKKWKKRWVVVKGPKLYYYHHEKKDVHSRKDRENERTKQEIDLIACQVEDLPRYPSGFLIRSCSRSYEFRAATVELKIMWTRIIVRARETFSMPPLTLSPHDPVTVTEPSGLVRSESVPKRSPVFKYNSMDSLFSIQSRRKSVCEVEDHGNSIDGPTTFASSTRSSSSWIGHPSQSRPSSGTGLTPCRSSRYSVGQVKSSNQSSPIRLRNSIVLSVNCSSIPVTPNSSTPNTPTSQHYTNYKPTILPADFDELPLPPSPILSSPSKSSERRRRLKFFGRK
eukprot:TRINITY_DN18241_c0_g1_i1.p1 TRINITY_DN18241_c0_g1~~TRINITY_DN18241_c0_g1_i1.p1  ORF type:complete len:506 (+),score=83.69 TRINITY_DN18241_c0_g1_i1:118-1635(+)